MARTGITYSDVENAVQQLVGRGKNPTVDGVREVLGTGSKSTIAQHLRSLRAAHTEGDPLALPQELLSLVSGLWEKLNIAADERIASIEHAAREQVSELSQINNKLQQDYTAISQQKIMLDEALILKERELDAISLNLQQEKQQNHVLVIQQEALSVQLEEMKNDNQRLHQLAAHIQANLEHYQSAMQKLQIEQNLVLEKQQAFFQQQLHELDTEAKFHRQKAFDTEHALQTSLSQVQLLTQQLEAKQMAHDVLTHTAQQTALALAKTENQLEQQGQTLLSTQQELRHQTEQLQTLTTQYAILNDQQQRDRGLLQQREDALELLRQEKLFLLQENAELKGYLKKMSSKAQLVHAE